MLYFRKELIDLEDSSLQFAVEYQRYLLIIDEYVYSLLFLTTINLNQD